MAGELAWYVQDARALLADANGLWITDAQLIRYINEARRQCAQRSGCIQRLIAGSSAYGASAQPNQMTPGGIQPGALPFAFPNASLGQVSNPFQCYQGVERYPFQGFANLYLQRQHQGCASIIDVGSIAISWEGSFRPCPNWMPWENLQAYARSYANQITSFPFAWSVLNDGENGEVWIFPSPSGNMEMEWLVYATPADLVSSDDYDAIPAGLRNAIKFGAVELAFMNSFRYAQAEYMAQQFAQRIGTGKFAADHGKISSFYWDAI